MADVLGPSASLDSWFVDAVNGLSRGGPGDLEPFLIAVGDDHLFDQTRSICRVHFLGRDANGRVLVQRLAKYLALHAVDFCLPRSRIAEAQRHLLDTGSAEMFVRLNSEARALFASSDKSGEAGEMMVFLLLERLLGIPQLLCKMSLKTNSAVHVHGTDGVHIKPLANGQIALYWCESKLHATAASAINSCFESITPFLLDDGTGPSQRDLLLVRDHLDTGDDDLDRVVVEYFVEGHEKSAQRVIRGATLLGFDLDDYPAPFERDGISVTAEVRAAIDGWHHRIQRRITEAGVSEFEVEIFCVPMPSVSDFRDAVRAELGVN